MHLSSADYRAMEIELCSRSFASYAKRAWPVIEPVNEYVHNWHMDAVGDHLEACETGEITRLLINVPPGTSKSTSVSVMYPTWLWGPKGRGSHRFIGASHDQELAVRDSRKCRNIVESDWYQDHWPTALVTDQNEKKYFENEFTGFRQAVAVKSMTGRRGDTIVWDDPHSPEKAYSPVERETAIRVFKETLPLRVVSPEKSVIIVMMQRLHEGDVSGHILEHDYGYVHLCLPMEYEPNRCFSVVAPTFMDATPVKARHFKAKHRWIVDGEPLPDEFDEDAAEIAELPVQTVYRCDPRTEAGELLFNGRFPKAVVERDKKVMGDFAVAGQFQQRPSPRGGGMFPVDRFGILPVKPNEHFVVERIRYWDKAGTADAGAFTAGVRMCKMQDGTYVVEHVYHKQLGALDRERKIKELADSDPEGTQVYVEQEPGSGGKESAEGTVRNLSGHAAYIDRVTGDKVTRATPYAAQVQANNVFLVKADWNQAFKDEHESFPGGKYKDQVDAGAGAFSKLQGSGKRAGVLF